MFVDYEKIFENGNFGIAYFKDEKEISPFVVVNDKIVYNTGEYDFVSSFKNVTLENHFTQILFVNKSCSFKDIEKQYNNDKFSPFPIYRNGKRIKTIDEKKSTKAALTISQIKDKLNINELTIICE